MTFNKVVEEAVRDISESGFSPERIAYWQERLRKAAAGAMGSQSRVDAMLKDALGDVYRRLIENGHALKVHPGVSRFTVDRLKPKLRVELQKRIFASADLIKLNREKSIAQTLQRFSGWATSIPPGGSEVVDKRAVKIDIAKSIRQEPYEVRRVLVDQGHKFSASISDIIATDNGAIAAVWQHHHSQHPRPEHEARDGHTFLIRDSAMHQKGFVKATADGYTDQIEQVAELPYCRCSYRYIYALRDLPTNMLTVSGREELDRIRREIRSRIAAFPIENISELK